MAQKRCKECGGSGLVLMDKDYFRCPECGICSSISEYFCSMFLKCFYEHFQDIVIILLLNLVS